MLKKDWMDSLNAGITICDKNGIITYMNEKSAADLSKYGGFKLLGKNLLDCHNESSKQILKDMFENESERIYTIEKEGVKKFICQKPIFEKGEFAGILEFVVILPSDMPHCIRD